MPDVVVATAFGGPEVLSVIDAPLPAPGAGEASIEVRAAGTNPVDYKLYSGTMGADPARLPMRVGAEAAGVVTAVGPGAAGPQGPLAVGDEVIAFRAAGAYAAALTVPGDALVRKPASLDWAPAAGLMLTGATAWHALAVTGVQAGDTVLMHGAAGGTGATAVQLAVRRGARVIATARPVRHEFLRELGAEPVAYGPGLAGRVRALAPGGVDAALDLVGTDEAIDVSVELVPDKARIVTIANARRGLEIGLKVIGGAPGADPGTEIRRAARLDLAALAGSGELRVFVTGTFPLTQAAQAHRILIGGHADGKIILLP
jgi:NADPH:quinone reductase-like Zn-dependent oxidoreductase